MPQSAESILDLPVWLFIAILVAVFVAWLIIVLWERLVTYFMDSVFQINDASFGATFLFALIASIVFVALIYYAYKTIVHNNAKYKNVLASLAEQGVIDTLSGYV